MLNIPRKNEALSLLLITSVSIFLLFFKLASLPAFASLDEIKIASFAASLKDSPFVTYYVKFDGYSDSHSTLLLYLILLSYHVFGISLFALRFVGAILGLVTITLFYFLLKKQFGPKYALLGSLVLSLSYKFIAFSRWTTELCLYFVFLVLSLLLLNIYYDRFREKQANAYKYLIGFGCSIGLMQYTYPSSRVFLVGSLLSLIFLYAFSRLSFKKIVSNLAIFIITLVISLYPLFVAYKNLPTATFETRVDELTILRKDVDLRGKLWTLKNTVVNTLGMFHFKSSDGSCYSYPRSKFLDPLSSLLFLIGLGYSFFKLGKLRASLYLILFLTALTPSFLSNVGATPHEVRASGAIIFTSFYSVLGLTLAGKFITNKKIEITFFVSILIFLLIYNFNSYFVRQMQNQSRCFYYTNEDFLRSMRENMEKTLKPYAIFNPWF